LLGSSADAPPQSLAWDLQQGGRDATDGDAPFNDAPLNLIKRAVALQQGARMNALELLKQDHRKVEGLFRQIEATEDSNQHERLFQQLKTELEIHTHIEETILYPALKKHAELRDLVLEAEEEHKQVKTLLREIERLKDGSERFDAKLKVMQENIEHHVEEEERELFPQLKQFYSNTELGQLGAELAAAQQTFGKSTPARATAR
jgi:hemerythrin superfamily protein